MSTPNKLSIKILQVLHGDALHIRFLGSDNKFHNIFIDGGFAKTYKATLQKEVKLIIENEEKIDLFVISHTDQDHISGVLAFIKEFGGLDLVDKYWFNHSLLDVMLRNPSDKISIEDGIKLRDHLVEKGASLSSEITSDIDAYTISGAILTILSPTKNLLSAFQLLWCNEENKRDQSSGRIVSFKGDYHFTVEQLAQNTFQEDDKLENGVSISFLVQVETKSILFLADSHPSTIVESLRRLGYTTKAKLRVDYVKIAHHGSKFNTSDELLALVDSDTFIVSTNGKNRYHFPHKETFARILTHPFRDLSRHIKFIFNYDNEVIRSIFTSREHTVFNFSCLYPEKGTNGYTITC